MSASGSKLIFLAVLALGALGASVVAPSTARADGLGECLQSASDGANGCYSEAHLKERDCEYSGSDAAYCKKTEAAANLACQNEYDTATAACRGGSGADGGQQGASEGQDCEYGYWDGYACVGDPAESGGSGNTESGATGAQ